MKPKSTTTGPRPKTKTVRKSKPDWLDCLDRIHEACHILAMLGVLMAGQGGEPLETEVVRDAGSLLKDQMKQLREALADLEEAR
jgi:hypothetical protein